MIRSLLSCSALLALSALIPWTAGAQQDVAFVTCSDMFPEIQQNLEDQLTPYGYTVTTYDDAIAVSLTSHDAVLFAPCGMPTTDWGDEFATALQGNTGIVMATFYGDNTFWNPAGTGWANYDFFTSWGMMGNMTPGLTGVIVDPYHMMMTGVSSFAGGDMGYRITGAALDPNTTVVAEWSDGEPLVVDVDTGIAWLNFFPANSDMGGMLGGPDFWDATTDGTEIIVNTLQYVSCQPEDLDGDGYDTADCGGLDCDDSDPAIHPAAQEICNDGIDQNCDGQTNEADDADGDGYTNCDTPSDCDDFEADAYPGNLEVCDFIDNNCDGEIDEDFDVDGDGWTTCGGDCDDNVATTYPNAAETCNGVDDDCDGSIDEATDDDGDGYTICAGDCDDNDPNTYPFAPEICDENDNDCDGALPAYNARASSREKM